MHKELLCLTELEIYFFDQGKLHIGYRPKSFLYAFASFEWLKTFFFRDPCKYNLFDLIFCYIF